VGSPTSLYATSTLPPWDVVVLVYKCHGLSVGNSTPIHTFLCTMAFRAAPDPEAQPQDCAWSTILNRGLVLSRHNDPPLPGLPSLLPCPDDPPPAYTATYPPPLPPISGGDPSDPESATNRTVDGPSYSLFAIVIALILVVAFFATAVYFTFFHHSKV
jgi:hypothetical protein